MVKHEKVSDLIGKRADVRWKGFVEFLEMIGRGNLVRNTEHMGLPYQKCNETNLAIHITAKLACMILCKEFPCGHHFFSPCSGTVGMNAAVHFEQPLNL